MKKKNQYQSGKKESFSTGYVLHMLPPIIADTRNPARAAMKIGKLSEEEEEEEGEGGCGIVPKTVG